ncbi:MAG: citrate transporter [Oscillospiraceae bacterium]|nr:citrate transporter [Oscillospiraceae bacterium]
METQRKKAFSLLESVKRDPVLFASFLLATASAFLVPPSAAYLAYLDIRVLCLLLSLMLVVAGLKEAGLFHWMVDKLLRLVHSTRALSVALTCVCFFSSMLITNDVALITFVPLSILLLTETGKHSLLIPVIVLQTIAANLGSMLTPLGNPQNLYLYSVSGMAVSDFLLTMAFPTLISLLLLLAACCLMKNETIPVPEEKSSPLGFQRILPWILLFILCLLTVAHLVHYLLVLAIVIAAVLLLNRHLLAKADYGLLLTFIFFFIFIGNLKNVPAVNSFFSQLVNGRELTIGILLSQVISNVPAAMLLSGFTQSYKSLLVGVNLGGLGTLIASMASLISYKLYAATEQPKMGTYMAIFTGLNLLFLAILWPLTALLMPI